MIEWPSDGSVAVPRRGDAAVFLGAVVFFGLTWRLDFFVTDNWTIANTLVAVADGSLYFQRVPYGSLLSPGTHVHDGRIYGRNYGHAVLSLPALLALRAVAAFADVGLALVLLWSLALFGFVVAVGDVAGRRRPATAVGGLGATAALALNLWLAGTAQMTVGPRTLPLAALQSTTLVTGALTAVVANRLGSNLYDRRVGLFAAGVVTLATPVGVWATIPKRHALTALFSIATVHWFHRSRAAPDLVTATRFRALSYVPVGLTAWVHAPEGLVLFIALGTVDLATARSTHPAQLAVVGAAFVLAVLPMLVTNAAISGSPVEPPRALPAFDGPATAVIDDTGHVSATATPPTPDSDGGGVPGVPLLGPVAEKALVFLTYMTGSVRSLADLEGLYHVFVRGRPGLGVHRFGWKPVNLSVLESMPLLGALLAAPAMLYRRSTAVRRAVYRPRATMRAVCGSPSRSTDALVGTYLLLLVVMYMPRLPLHVTLTVRYLHPLYPLGAYLVVRVPVVRRVVRREWPLLTAAYGGCVLLGVSSFLLAGAFLAVPPLQLLQLNAGLALAGAGLLGYWGVVSAVTEPYYDRAGAAAVAFAAATSTTFVVLAPVQYFAVSDRFVLPAVRAVAGAV